MAGFTVQIFENSSLEVSKKSEIVATQAPELGQTKGRKVRFILGELFDTWSWQPNDRKWFWLDGIESCCVGVEGSSKSICVRRFSPPPLSLFRFHLSPFPQKRLILRLKLNEETSFYNSLEKSFHPRNSYFNIAKRLLPTDVIAIRNDVHVSLSP